VKIKHYGKDKKDFNFYEKSRENAAAVHQRSPTIIAESKENALPLTPENAESANSSVQTLGTPLSRLDTKMSRILNSPLPRDKNEKMYRENVYTLAISSFYSRGAKAK